MIRNEKGIALVTTLMLTLIGLGIILCLLYMITGSTRISGANKRYSTVLDATYGGAEIVVKDMVPYILRSFAFSAYSSNNSVNSAFITALKNDYNAIGPTVSNLSCLRAKISGETSTWSGSCGADATGSLPPVSAPDISFSLPGTGGNTYMVFAKIISTKTGNTSMSGMALEGSSVSEGSSTITPQHMPYLYTIETQGRRVGDTSATAHLEVLYAY